MTENIQKFCPICRSKWSEEEIELQECENCGYPNSENDEYDDIFFPDEYD